MMRVVGIIVAICSSQAWAQQAELEVPGVFGECNPVYAAKKDELSLYRRPDLRSERFEIPYRVGRRILAPKLHGLTRVLRIGTLRVIEPDDQMTCSVAPTKGPAQLLAGETVECEGFGEIRLRGGQCRVMIEDPGHIELIEPPDVQIWLRVYFADGSSPGWLYHDGSQTSVADVLC